MGAQRTGLGVLRVELVHQLGPQDAAGAQLGDLRERVHGDAPEERQARGELVDVQARIQAGADVLDAIGQRVRQLQVGGRTGFLDVVAGDGDRVELRHLQRGVFEDGRDDPHRRLRRVDVGVADHELLEDVVLHGAAQFLGGHALLLGGDDVHRHHRQDRAVHGHGHGHAAQVDAVEQLAHVVDRVDGHAGHADVARHARVVRVVAAVGGQVERDRQALLAGGQVAAVERVGLGGGGEAGVLADRPRLVGVHGRVRAAHERGQARERVHRVAFGGRGLTVGALVDALDVDALGDRPRLGGGVGLGGRSRGGVRVGPRHVRETGDGGHWSVHAPRESSSRESSATASMFMVR